MNNALAATLKNTQLLSVPLSTKYTLRIRNLCAQHDTVAESKKSHIVTCVCVNAIRTILQFTLVTHGHLLRVRLGATKGTNILIIIVLLCRCSPYMCRYVFPRTIWRVPYLSSNQKLLQMQEYTHALMQLRTGSPPYVPYDAPVPQACKQVLNACPIETMNIMVLLLPLSQRLSTDKWPCHMEAPLVCTIHGGWGPKEGGNATSPLHSRGSPNNGGQNQKSKRTLGVTMMLLVSKRGFKDCPGFLNSTGRLGPKRGRKCYVTLAFSGVPNKGNKIRSQNLRYGSP